MMNELDLADGQDGFRLDGVELYNWGTFGRTVWTFPFNGENALITGDIGSGKSTWVDALTTLLVPPQKITYNKAAGAEKRERTDRSYILGEYRSSRGDGAAYSKPVNLRDEKSYSVIIATFADFKASRRMSLAQVRWIKAGEVQRVYVNSGRRLSVLEDFKDFDGDGAALKRRLRAMPATEAFDSYSDYAGAFRSSMGISEKGLELFNQTVSMKTIGDLDDFIRDHMLEPTAARDRIDEILRNFDNLRAAHDSVEASRLQRDALIPIRTEGAEHQGFTAQMEDIRSMGQVLPYYALRRKIPLLETETGRLDLELAATNAAVESLETELEERREAQASLRSAIDNSEAGRRIRELDAEMERTSDERDRRRLRLARYQEPLDRLSRPMPADAPSFVALRSRLEADLPGLETERTRLMGVRDTVVIERTERTRHLEMLDEELESLRKRTTSIPLQESNIRRVLAEAVGSGEKDLPFAGELMRVKESERAWEGAAERVLRPFALSIMVPERLYKAVSEYVRTTRLDGRIVYYRASEVAAPLPRVHERSLSRIMEVKPDAPFRSWLESEIARRANYVRCNDMDDFYREPDAVTVEGLFKSGNIRHEKDDRRKVADPRNYVLGWSNKEKIALLERDRAEGAKALAETSEHLAEADIAIAAVDDRKSDTLEVLRVESFDDIDVDSAVTRYKILRSEREALERSNDQLAGLRSSLEAITGEIARLDTERSRLLGKAGGIENNLARRRTELEQARVNLAAADAAELLAWFDKLDAFVTGPQPGLDGVDDWQSSIRQRLDTRRATLDRKDSDLRSSLYKRMFGFLSLFTEYNAELKAGLEFLSDFLALLERIERDDLPSYENRFRALLKESTLRDIALFQTNLEDDAQAIREAIEIINESLAGIEYNSGTFISLAAERKEDQAVKDFRSELRGCLENTLGDDDLYSEGKFIRVKGLLSRFAGSEPADKSWTEHVTDVRSWFTFTASERWIEDNTEKEFYSSSSGKSGGQKEKLAYTILASALAYQYGHGSKRSAGGFRLVVIDEAFGRGSEESTRYGLKLFGKLGLQLVLITPLQKIGVIESSVATIHFIANPDGKSSEVRSMSLREYREEKAARAAVVAS